MVQTQSFNFWQRLKEIDQLQGRGEPVHETLQRLVSRLHRAGIPYAIMGGMAVSAHGYHQATDDVDVLLTSQGLDQFREQWVGVAYEQVPGRSRRLVDHHNGILVDVQITGHYPGWDGPVPFAFPDPQEASEEIDHVHVLTLPQLLQLKLATGRPKHFADVVRLIRANDLDQSFQDNLHPSIRGDYIECLEEIRREEEFEARP